MNPSAISFVEPHFDAYTACLCMSTTCFLIEMDNDVILTLECM